MYAAGFTTAFGAHAVAANLGVYTSTRHGSLLTLGILLALCRPAYDLVFLDGAKNWTTDGLAVLLAERLLRPGGWLLLDDLSWSYGGHAENPWHYGVEIARLAEDEKALPHLRAVFDLLVRANPAFDRAWVQEDWWGWARKAPRGLSRLRAIRQLPAPRAAARSRPGRFGGHRCGRSGARAGPAFPHHDS